MLQNWFSYWPGSRSSHGITTKPGCPGPFFLLFSVLNILVIWSWLPQLWCNPLWVPLQLTPSYPKGLQKCQNWPHLLISPLVALYEYWTVLLWSQIPWHLSNSKFACYHVMSHWEIFMTPMMYQDLWLALFLCIPKQNGSNRHKRCLDGVYPCGQHFLNLQSLMKTFHICWFNSWVNMPLIMVEGFTSSIHIFFISYMTTLLTEEHHITL